MKESKLKEKGFITGFWDGILFFRPVPTEFTNSYVFGSITGALALVALGLVCAYSLVTRLF